MPDRDSAMIVPTGHTRPIGRYSPAVAVPLDAERDLVFVSGQVASDAEGRVLCPSDPAGQAEAVFDRLDAVLAEAGGGVQDLVSVVVYVTDMRHFDAVNGVRNRVLSTDPPPASALVEVSRLAIPEHLVEISGVAVVRRGATR